MTIDIYGVAKTAKLHVCLCSRITSIYFTVRYSACSINFGIIVSQNKRIFLHVSASMETEEHWMYRSLSCFFLTVFTLYY